MIEPHYFGPIERPLLGIYHPPTGRARPHGVVICAPAPQEYMRTHMALRKLAVLLASAGFHVLRFDYYGTGDSAGGSGDGSLTEWCRNVDSAVVDLKECSGATKISLVGLRLGATLAALSTARVAKLVLWEPVVTGRDYLHELQNVHRQKFSNLLYPPPAPTAGGSRDLLGVSLPLVVEREIAAIDLPNSIRCRADEIALLTSRRQPDLQKLQTSLENAAAAGGPGVACHEVPVETRPDHDSAMILPAQVLQLVTDVLSGRAG
ncbi:MAG: alpha/beta hydrolase [Vicinamibacterales bacterium]